MSSGVSAILRECIRKEEERILSSLPGERRWGVLELVRAVDHRFVWLLGLDRKAVGEETERDTWHLYRYGVSKAISLFMDESIMREGPSLTRSTSVLQQWAEAVIQHCGRVAGSEMALELQRYGLVELSMPSHNEIHVMAIGPYTGVESLEAAEFGIFHDLAAEIDEQLRADSTRGSSYITEQMSLLVSPWRQDFIQYRTNPDIDVYYQTQGLIWARGHYEPGQDAFPPQASFGGLSYELYKRAVVEVIGWALKHIGFCRSLLNKYPHLDIRNILTVTKVETWLSAWLVAALRINENEATQILSTLKLTPNNQRAHLSAPAVNIAPLLAINPGTVIFSIAGSLSSPFDFMLEELQRQYRKDWDRAVNLREEYFRKELYDLFPSQRFAKVSGPLKLKQSGRITTDIDAAIFDKEAGTLGLFQLKWQDPFGTSMRRRNTKKKNFLGEANQWVSTVSAQLIENPKSIYDLVGERIGSVDDVRRAHLFVIGRHFSHFSGDINPNSGAAWGMWPQVLRLFRELRTGSDPITWLYEMLVSEAPHRRIPTAVDGYKMQLGEYCVIYDPIAVP